MKMVFKYTVDCKLGLCQCTQFVVSHILIAKGTVP